MKKMTKNKKGFFGFTTMIVVYMILAIILLLLIWLIGSKVSSSISSMFDPVMDFFSSYGIWVLAVLLVVIFRKQVIAIINWILSKLGIRV